MDIMELCHVINHYLILQENNKTDPMSYENVLLLAMTERLISDGKQIIWHKHNTKRSF